MVFCSGTRRHAARDDFSCMLPIRFPCLSSCSSITMASGISVFLSFRSPAFPFNCRLSTCDMLYRDSGLWRTIAAVMDLSFGSQGRPCIFSAINLLLFVLTPFVVPLIVLEQKTLREAVVGSFAMMKKTWAEAAACAVFLGGYRIRVCSLCTCLSRQYPGWSSPLATLLSSTGYMDCSCPPLRSRTFHRCVCRGNGRRDRSAGSLQLCKERADTRIPEP